MANYRLWPIFTSPCELKIVFTFLKVIKKSDRKEKDTKGKKKKKNIQLRFYASYKDSSIYYLALYTKSLFATVLEQN